MRVVVAIVVAAVGLAGCSGTDATVTPAPTSTATEFSPAPMTPTPTPTATPTPTREMTEAERQQAAAIEAVEEFLAVTLDLARDDQGDLNRINQVAFEPARREQIEFTRARWQNGVFVAGDGYLDDATARVVDGGVWVRGCLDASDVRLVDAQGNTLPGGPQPRGSYQWMVVYDDASEGWYVSEQHEMLVPGTDTELVPC